ncbi:3360_t:CDS:2, partial [Scutellospora calospora]
MEYDEAMQEVDILDSSPSPTTSTTTTLKSNTYRETELQLQIDELVEEIAQIESKIINKNGQDSSSTCSGNGKKRERGKGIECDDIAGNDDICWEEFEAPEWCVPIKADVLTFEWDVFAKECQFDVILMDPPWQLATHAPTRGVAIAYQQLPDICIEELPIPKLQKNGFLFIWVINNKYSKAFEMMKKWGYCDDITWVKQTVNRRMAKGHGFYLQHAKETCLMGRKGKDPPGCKHSISSDVIFSERRGQSQKPEELYEMIEELVPN